MPDFGPLLERTHQTWKLTASTAATVLGVGVYFLPNAFHSGVPNLWVVGCSILLCAGSSVLFLWTVRCPVCRANWVWQAAKQRSTNWVDWLRQQHRCPSCGASCIRVT